METKYCIKKNFNIGFATKGKIGSNFGNSREAGFLFRGAISFSPTLVSAQIHTCAGVWTAFVRKLTYRREVVPHGIPGRNARENYEEEFHRLRVLPTRQTNVKVGLFIYVCFLHLYVYQTSDSFFHIWWCFINLNRYLLSITSFKNSFRFHSRAGSLSSTMFRALF